MINQAAQLFANASKLSSAAREQLRWDILLFPPHCDGEGESHSFDINDTLIIELLSNWDSYREMIVKTLTGNHPASFASRGHAEREISG